MTKVDGGDPVYVTPSELADRWNTSAETIRGLIGTGELPAMRVGHMYRIKWSDVVEWESQAAVTP